MCRRCIDPADRRRVERLELFDEFEEWDLIQVSRGAGKESRNHALCCITIDAHALFMNSLCCSVCVEKLKGGQKEKRQWVLPVHVTHPATATCKSSHLLPPQSNQKLTPITTSPTPQAHYCIALGIKDETGSLLEGFGFPQYAPAAPGLPAGLRRSIG